MIHHALGALADIFLATVFVRNIERSEKRKMKRMLRKERRRNLCTGFRTTSTPEELTQALLLAIAIGAAVGVSTVRGDREKGGTSYDVR